MQQVKAALELTTSHGLPRTVTQKPLYVRLTWALLFLASVAMFIKGFLEFLQKLQNRQVTSSLESNKVDFKFPDIYVCFENPISPSYASALSNASTDELNRQLASATEAFRRFYNSSMENFSSADLADTERWYSFAYLQSLQYNLLADTLAHRLEQAVVTSDVAYINNYGLPTNDAVQPGVFYHPVHLRCIRWQLNSTLKSTLAKGGTSSGLVVTLLADTNYSASAPSGPPLLSKVFVSDVEIPVSDWSLARLDFDDPDRRAGVRVYLCPPGEYPTVFATSFSLGPGRYHTVEMSMSEQVYNPASFDDCLSDPQSVQFVNPYSQEPYDHAYSYSYCYFYEYHRQYQTLMNLSGDASPMPWPLRGYRYLFNLTGTANFLQAARDSKSGLVPDSGPLASVAELARARCARSSPCTTVKYDVSVSSTDWPVHSSIGPFVAATVVQALADVRPRNLTAPALDRLVSFDPESAANFIRANLLKVNFRPHRSTCDRVTLSIDYGPANFISDIGGIMGIYLGMSLLTLCELLELFYDLVVVVYNKRHQLFQSSSMASQQNTGIANGHCPAIMITRL